MRIFVIEVVADVRSSTRLFLETLCFAVAEFDCAEALLAGDVASLADWLVMVYHLPGLSGWDLLAWVRARPEFDRLPMLLWTSLPNPEGKDRALRQGAAGYLGKPRDLDGYRQLAARVARLLGD